MSSHEDQMRAVELYIKLGKRAKATIRQLGYPSKNTLKGWRREYEHHLDLRLEFAPRATKFTQAQKEAAVDQYRTYGRCISATMRALGYPGCATLTGWVR
jgi:putative transposase